MASFNSFAQILIWNIISIKDGNTVVVMDSLYNKTTLRLADIDCPEKNQHFGNRAKQFSSSQIYQETVI